MSIFEIASPLRDSKLAAPGPAAAAPGGAAWLLVAGRNRRVMRRLDAEPTYKPKRPSCAYRRQHDDFARNIASEALIDLVEAKSRIMQASNGIEARIHSHRPRLTRRNAPHQLQP